MPSHRLKMSLLPALQALLESGSVTDAAASMHVTQSTMSRTLGQLREALNDPILVRDGNHIYLSNKARELKPLVARLVADADALFDAGEFSPSSCEKHFRLVAGTGIQQDFLVKQLAQLSKIAPGMTFSIDLASDSALTGMEKGELDLGFVHLTNDDCQGLRVSPVADTELVVVVRRGHSLAEEMLSNLSQLDDFSYVEVNSPLLANRFVMSHKRQSKSLSNPWVRVAGTQMALELVNQCDAYTVIGCPVLNNLSSHALLPLSIDLVQSRLSLVWPGCWEFDQAHQWLRKFFEAALRKYFYEAGALERIVSA